MTQLAKSLIVFGIALVLAGGVLLLAQRLGLGRLPGDFSWKGKYGTLQLPLATSLLLSLVLTLLLNLWLGKSR
jgi:Protein of unknown function (DUF2905)